jgi:hypothetical protein
VAANRIYLQVDLSSDQAQANVNALNKTLADTGTTAETSADKTTKSLNKVSVTVEQTSKSFAALGTAVAGLGIGRAMEDMIGMSAELGRAKQAMEAFTGNAQDAVEVFDQIRAIAAQTPFRFKDLEEAGRQLLGFGMAAKDVPNAIYAITKQVGDMGGSVDSVTALVRIFGRVMEKDFVGAMDLFRTLPQQGVKVMEALRTAVAKQAGHPVAVEDIKKLIKDNVLDPLKTVQLFTQEMNKSKPFDFTHDAGIALKNLGDNANYAASEFFGPNGFGPAIAKLAGEIQQILAPLAAFIMGLTKLSEPTKEWIVNIVFAVGAVLGLATAFKALTLVGGPLIDTLAGMAKGIWSVVTALAAMDLEVLAAIGTIALLGYAAYRMVPGFQKMIDGWTKSIKDWVGSKLSPIVKEGQKLLGGMFKPPTLPEVTDVAKQQTIIDAEQAKIEKLADTANKSLLQALVSPVEAVQMKYTEVFAEMEKNITALTSEQQEALRTNMRGVEAIDIQTAQVKARKETQDELQKYEIEKIKGTAEIQIAYLEAMDEQDLKNKVANLDKITDLRIKAEEDVATYQKNRVQQDLQYFLELAEQYRTVWTAAGINVDKMIQAHRDEAATKQTAIDQKAFDEEQKYRLEGWKKVNDAIIADQKRVFDAFKDMFGQFFDAITSKDIGKAVGDMFKKLAMGELKESFSSVMAGAATQAAGYGQPEESIPGHGQGILGILLRRGMPPRAPMAPPSIQDVKQTTEDINYSSANLISGSSTVYAASAGEFAAAVQEFKGIVSAQQAMVQTQGEAGRSMEEPPMPSSDVLTDIARSAAKYNMSPTLVRAVAEVESSYRPRAVSSAGAAGIMQLMPRTAAGYGAANVFDPAQNIDAGTHFLADLSQKYGGDLPHMLAEYNAGAVAMRRAGGGIPSFTRPYISSVMSVMQRLQPDEAPPPPVVPAVSMQDLVALPTLDNSANMARMLTMGEVPGPTGLEGGAFSLGGGFMGGLMAAGAGGGTATVGPTVQQLQNLPQTSALSSMAKLLFPLMGKAGAGQKAGVAIPKLGDIGQFFGVIPGMTSAATVLGSKAMGSLATMGGMMLLSKGLQQRNAPATAIGGGLAGMGTFLTSPSMIERSSTLPGGAGLGFGAAAATGVGLGLFASGFQRGGGAGLGMDVAGGALAGAGIGTMIAPGLGTAIGAGIGAVAGAITGAVRLFVKTEQEKIRSQVKQVYGIDISNRQILSQIQQIVDSKYGGNVSVGIRSQDVQDMIRLYALSTGQAAMLPRPMYNATFAQSGGNVALQPVYQGGVLVQNPYTGPTTYQYQTAVTAAEGLKAGTSLGVPGASNIIGNTFMQLNPQQANDLLTGKIISTVQGNPSAVASSNAAAMSAGDSRMTTTASMLEPLTALS